MSNLTKSQLLARDHRDGDVLIAAGAGSGKTKVLTERVLKLIVHDEVPLSSLLLLTFTNAAAAEMKDRIRKALLKANRLDLASKIDQSFIMTFDAFALFLVQKYAYAFQFDPRVGIYEATLYEVERKRILNTIFMEGYRDRQPDFIKLIKQFVVNRDDALKAFVLKIDAKADLMVDKLGYYRQYLERHFESGWVDDRRKELFALYRQEILMIQHLAVTFENSHEAFTFDQITQELLRQPTLDDLLMAIKAVEFQRAKPKSLSESDKGLRDRLKADIKLLKADAEMVPIQGQIDQYDGTKPYIAVLIDMLVTLNERLEAKKRQYQRYPFADIAKMAMRLLDQEPIRASIQQQFRYIMVDEYQDTNDLQEAFLLKIANRNLFMVGDIKQSIYRFRNANSQIFYEKFQRYQDYESVSDKHETRIVLQDNFRSRPEVLHEINQFFGLMMTKAYGGVDYDHTQQLNPSQTKYANLTSPSMGYTMDVLRYEKTDQDPQLNEATIIARDIIDKMNAKIMVANLEQNEPRPITFKDFTILIDRKTNFESYLEVFNQHGIPLEVFAERDLSNSDLFRVLKNLITLLVHGEEKLAEKTYQHAYVSVLRSFIFKEKDQDLYAWSIGQKPLQSFALFPLLAAFRLRQSHETLFSFIQGLLQTLEIEQKLLTIPDLPANLARLEGWVEKVKALSDMGYTLPDFEDFLKESQHVDVDLTIAAPKQSEDAVQLMTIHKSKGLEFAYVYYPGLTKGFNMMDTKGLYQYSKRYGIQLPYPEAAYARPIFADLILNEEKAEIISEQMRLWYVALTRAKEKIILVIESSEPKKIVDIEKAHSIADFVHLYHEAIGHDITKDFYVKMDQPMPTLEVPGFTLKDLPVEFSTASQSFETVTPRRASKAYAEDVDEATLVYGTYLHECLFLLDFKTLDTSFIPVAKDRQMIDQLLKLPYFQQVSKLAKSNQINILKEYAYLDEVTGQKGIIDLVIIQGKQATILDYKTNNIEDPNYVNQLQTYARYLTSAGLIVDSMYLISLTKATLKKI
jgi:ATP-dependent helicase/nuclease subunit A